MSLPGEAQGFLCLRDSLQKQQIIVFNENEPTDGRSRNP
jgi:hypothetical protein